MQRIRKIAGMAMLVIGFTAAILLTVERFANVRERISLWADCIVGFSIGAMLLALAKRKPLP